MNSNGAYQWHTFYGEFTEETADIVIDSNDNIYVVGIDQSPFWAGTGVALKGSSGGDDIFIVKLNSDGVRQWHTFYGPATPSTINFSGTGFSSIAIDGSDNIYIAGVSESSWLGALGDLPLHAFNDAGSTSVSLKDDIFVLKLNNDGAYQWHTFYPITGTSFRGITTDSNGNIYTTGRSSASWQGDGNVNAVRAHSNLNNDFTILKLADSDNTGTGGVTSGTGGGPSDSSGSGGGSSLSTIELIVMLATLWILFLMRRRIYPKRLGFRC